MPELVYSIEKSIELGAPGGGHMMYGLKYKTGLDPVEWNKWKESSLPSPNLGLKYEFLKNLNATIEDNSRNPLRNKIIESYLSGKESSDAGVYISMAGGKGSGRDELYRQLIADEYNGNNPIINQLKEKLKKLAPITLDHEDLRPELIRGLNLGFEPYDKQGRIVDPRLRDLVHHEISFTLTSVLHNAAANGLNSIMNWSCHAGGGGQFDSLRTIAETHGKKQKIILIGTFSDIEKAMKNAADSANEKNEFQGFSGALASHAGFARNFELLASKADEVYLFDTTKRMNLVVVKKEGGELEIIDRNSFNKFIAQANIDLNAKNLKDALSSVRKK